MLFLKSGIISIMLWLCISRIITFAEYTKRFIALRQWKRVWRKAFGLWKIYWVFNTMKNLFQNTAFIIGFGGVFFIFLILNILPHPTDPIGAKFNVFGNDRGFPLVWFDETISSTYNTEYYWSGLVINLAIALVCSFFGGWFLKLIWSNRLK